jgi:UDP-N-acetylmuramoyl-L-alanyl-D-glutamate--2,6-diaminopimelate ligase
VFVNADDPYSEYMIQNCSADVQTFGIDKSCQNTADSISMYKTENSLGMMFDYCCSQGKFPLSIKFPGRFSVSNALAAITACKAITDDISAITEALSQISVEGRFEVVQALPYATIVIDYAHNGASMRSVLETIRMYSPRKIITLFGSVGGRTFMRRAELGKVASQLSDYCILTADNPDCEDPRNIIYDIAKSFDPDGCRYYAIPDREKAIVHAMSLLEPGDVLLLAGKGHENYQLVRGRRVPFCERQIVLDAAEAIQKNKV